MLEIITTESIIAYFQCPRKAYLLQCTDEEGIPHEYDQILQSRREENKIQYLNMLVMQGKNTVPYSKKQFERGDSIIANARLHIDGLEADCGLLENQDTDIPPYYTPVMVLGTYSIIREHKLALMFIGHILSKLQPQPPERGKIVKMGQQISTIRLKDSSQRITPLLERLQQWKTAHAFEPPPIILNRQCTHCAFHMQCRTQAEHSDHLSLLDRISTIKVIKKYERKGIFTVNQLSYLYRPRKQRKRARKPPSLQHSVELQALVLRIGKIYVKETPQLERQPVELFLDIEGIPDQQFFYLIGLLICEDSQTTYHGFWADAVTEEEAIWQQFIAKVTAYPDAPIYHYGTYESHAIVKLGKRYDTQTETLVNRCVNINTYIYGKIYFPVRSNTLKDLGKFVGASWTACDASGLQSIVWRYRWEDTQQSEDKQRLLTYNQEDCCALKEVTDVLSSIQEHDDALFDIDCFVHAKKSRSTTVNNPLHTQLESILTFAHRDYNATKICFQQANNAGTADEQSSKKSRPPYEKRRYRITRTIQVSEAQQCSKCKSENLHITLRKTERILADLNFTQHGVRKSVTKYWGYQVHCRECKNYSPPPLVTSKAGRFHVLGHGFELWIVYQRVALRLSYRNIEMISKDLFKEKISGRLIEGALRKIARTYATTEAIMVRQLLTSPFLHVDETLLNIDHLNQYVWVITNGQYVFFKYTKTREATFIQDFLKDYTGVLVADFYPGYDTLTCPQQKCLVHLIRDLNNDLYANPFDAEFETFIRTVKDLFVPIMAAIQRYGLKKWHLRKFQKTVEKFYATTIAHRVYKSDLCTKYQERFSRYRENLFTFLEHDNIPWHNNPAENALRHITIQQKMSTVFHASVMNEYLTLLGIRQSCKFQKKSFLKFLISGEKDITKFSKAQERNASYRPL